MLRVAKQEETRPEDMQTLSHQPGLPPTELLLIKQTLMIWSTIIWGGGVVR